MKKYWYIFSSSAIIALLLFRFGMMASNMKFKADAQAQEIPPVNELVLSEEAGIPKSNAHVKLRELLMQRKEIPKEKVLYHEPREGVPENTPSGDGFWSFGFPVKGVLTRSGQPNLEHYKWLKEQGTKSVVNLRKPGEYGEKARDTQIKGFEELGFNYLELPIRDGAAPTDEQAEKFLLFVTDPQNQPVHVHCRGGYGRAGTMVALYRYVVQGWPLDSAIKESRLYNGGISRSQETWLKKWTAKQQKELQ